MKSRTLSLVLCTALAACGGNEPPADKAPGLVIGGDDAGASPASLYQMPTPNELFGLVKELAGESHKGMLNPASNADRYVTLKARAFNFGVYSTDLVYASCFKMNVEVARYYLTSKKMAESLGVTTAFTDNDFVRLEGNLTRGDSLEFISNEGYLAAYGKLQEEEMGPTLALVLAGGWVESMHLVMRQIDTFGKNDALMLRVGEQKVTLEHLIKLMGANESNADVAGLYKELVAIRDIYDQVNVKRVAHEGLSTSGRMVLGDDMRIDLTAEKYNELVQAVERLRTAWTAVEDKTNA
ncbi:MAG: hypothetical protein ABI432_19855 [Flavobacteriales bacterium]